MRRWSWCVMLGMIACGARSTLADVDLSNGITPDDGGARGHDGGPSSRCRDAIIGRDASGATVLTLDGDAVFWGTTDGLIERHDDGGNTQLLATEASAVTSIAVDSARVYYTIDGFLKAISRSGGTATTLLDHLNRSFSLTFDDGNLYLADHTDVITSGRILRTDLAGHAQELLTRLDLPSGIAVDADAVYVGAVLAFDRAGNTTKGPLHRLPKTGGAPTLLASGLVFPTSLVIDATRVFVEDQYPDAYGPGGLLVLPKAGGVPTIAVPAYDALSLAFALDSEVAYRTTYSAPRVPGVSTLSTFPIDEPIPTVLATTEGVVYGHARTSPTSVYWPITWSPGQPPSDGASVRKKCR